MHPVVERLLVRCTFPPPGTPAIAAFSGGPDSSALLALGVAAGLHLTAVHVDHGSRPGSDVDARRAEHTAAALGVEFVSHRVELEPGSNFEARARTARRSVIGPAAMTGHTADDQAETVLLALMRGSGATGLAAMSPGPTKPILALRRAETEAVCTALQLDVVRDPTNADRRFVRNRIRHELLPLMGDVVGRDVTELLCRASDLLRDDDELLDQLAEELDVTDALAVAAAPLPLARRAVRAWLRDDDHPPSAAAVDRVLAVARGEATACEPGGNRRVERSGQRLRLLRSTDPAR